MPEEHTTTDKLELQFGDTPDKLQFAELQNLRDWMADTFDEDFDGSEWIEAVEWAIENLYETSIMLSNMRTAIEKEDNESNLELTRKKLGIS